MIELINQSMEGRKVARADHRFSVSIHDRWTGEKWTVHLVQSGIAGRFWPKFNGRNSKKYPDITCTQLGSRISGWIRQQQGKAWL